MCICPAGEPAEFDGGEGTHIGVFIQPDATQVVLYGCEAVAADSGATQTDEIDWDSSGYKATNRASCMLVVLPVKKGTFQPDRDLLDVSAYPEVLKDVVDSVVAKPQPKYVSRGLGEDDEPMAFGLDFAGQVTHTNVGKFEVLTCTDARDLHKVVALVKDPAKQIPADRHPLPELGERLQKWYGETDFVFVLAFFDGSDPSRSVLAARITPRNPNIVVFPGLDNHDPKELPKPAVRVARKHSLVVSVPGLVGGKSVTYTGDELGLPFTPPATACGWRVEGTSQNGDWAIPVHDLTKEGPVRLFTMLPPGAERPANYRQEVVACQR